LSEIQKKINECIAEIEPYTSYATMADRAISSLREIESLIKNPSEENLEKALKMVTEFQDRIEMYASYVPTTTKNVKIIREWLEKAKR